MSGFSMCMISGRGSSPPIDDLDLRALRATLTEYVFMGVLRLAESGTSKYHLNYIQVTASGRGKVHRVSKHLSTSYGTYSINNSPYH